MKLNLLFLFGMLFSLCVTGQTNDEQARREKEITQRLRDYEHALKTGDVEALGKLYTTDSSILHHGKPATVGREKIRDIFSKFIKDSITGSSFQTTGLWGNDEVLVEEGTGTWYHANGASLGSGYYLLVWKKEEGEWRIFRDTWFSDGDGQ